VAAPFFIVSSGRSGTAMLHKALSAGPSMEMHHEYMVQVTQPLAVKRYLGLTGEEECRRIMLKPTARQFAIAKPDIGGIPPINYPG